MQQYERELICFNSTNDTEFRKLMDDLIAAFLYQPITIQKVIHILIVWHKEVLVEMQGDNNASIELESSNSMIIESYKDPYSETSSTAVCTVVPKKRCYAKKCHLLQAKGIIQWPMLCVTGRNVCSGCISESTKLRRLDQLENEIMILMVENSSLAPLLQFRTEYTSIKTFWKILSCLPTLFNNKRRNDHIFGAARYLANTQGIKVYA
jgi:hypothetical protein